VNKQRGVGIEQVILGKTLHRSPDLTRGLRKDRWEKTHPATKKIINCPNGKKDHFKDDSEDRKITRKEAKKEDGKGPETSPGKERTKKDIPRTREGGEQIFPS